MVFTFPFLAEFAHIHILEVGAPVGHKGLRCGEVDDMVVFPLPAVLNMKTHMCWE